MAKMNNNVDELVSLFGEFMDSAELLKSELQAKISSAIVKKRIEMGLSQKEFAEYLGVSQGLVSRWESSNHNFTINTIADVFDKLGIDVDITIGNEAEYRTFNGFWKDDSTEEVESNGFFIEYALEKDYNNPGWTYYPISNDYKTKPYYKTINN